MQKVTLFSQHGNSFQRINLQRCSFVRQTMLPRKQSQERVRDTHSENEDHEEHSFGDIIIHQAVETIDVALGVVSDTYPTFASSCYHSHIPNYQLCLTGNNHC